MSRELAQLLRDELRSWEAAGLRRELPQDDAEPLPPRGDFRCNDYLGLSRDERVIAAARDALESYGAGARAARLLGGGLPPAAAAERAAAEWLGEEQALLFPSGYQANLGVIGALAGRGDALFSDESNHASLIDGCRLSRAQVHVFRHRDVEELARQLALARGARRRLVVSETIFSMDGDLAPLSSLHELCERFDAWLVLDEAHAIGLLGPQGAGAWAATGRRGRDAARLAARVVTGGKALGVGGAFAVGGEALRDLLLQRARSFVFTTAPPPMVAAALAAAIEACRGANEARSRTVALARRLASALALPPPDAAFVPLVVGDARRTLELGEALRDGGFAVGAVRPPTVPDGGSRLRLVAHAFNDEGGVDELARRIGEASRHPGATPPGAAAAATPAPRDLAPTWFVVGTDTSVGKTVVSALLLRAAKRLGRTAYWKPVQTGDESDSAAVRALAGARDDEVLSNEHHFALPASPHEAAAHAGATIDPAGLAARLIVERRRFGVASGGEPEVGQLIVELAGGLLVPYRAGASPFLQADWLATAGARVVVVARSGLGTLNHTLLTLEALRARHLEPASLFLVGERHESNAATLRELGGVARLFEVPRFEPLAPAKLDEWLAANDLVSLLGPAR